MSSTQSTPKRPRSARRDTSTTPKKNAATKKASPRSMSAEQRLAMIAEFAYLRAEQRGFHMSDPVADWLESEKEVDALLSRSAG